MLPDMPSTIQMPIPRAVPIAPAARSVPIRPGEADFTLLPADEPTAVPIDPSTEGRESLPAAPAGTEAERTRTAAEQMVAGLFVQPMLDAAMESPFGEGPFAPGAGEKAFRPLLNQRLADGIVGASNLPLVDAIVRQIAPGDAPIGDATAQRAAAAAAFRSAVARVEHSSTVAPAVATSPSIAVTRSSDPARTTSAAPVSTTTSAPDTIPPRPIAIPPREFNRHG